MSAVVPLRPASQALLTKKQLAAALGRSERWIELKQRDGLPIASTDRYGRRRYRLADVDDGRTPRRLRQDLRQTGLMNSRAKWQSCRPGGRLENDDHA
jgi:hypothetical protein